MPEYRGVILNSHFEVLVKYLFTLCVLLLNGFHQISAHGIEQHKTNSEVCIEDDLATGHVVNAYHSELHKSTTSHRHLFDIDATDVQEEENEINSPFLVFANSKFLTAVLCAFFFLFLLLSLRKGISFYSRLRNTTTYQRYILFCDFRI